MVDKKITHLADRTKDASRWTVEQMLDDALSGVREHRRTPSKTLLLYLDAENGSYDVGFVQSGLSMSEAVSLLEVAKQVLMKEMGY